MSRAQEVEWTSELSINLIDEYKKFPVLWYPKHEHHFSRNKKIDAWKTISIALGIDVMQVKQKINSLLGSFRREKAKGKKSIGTGKGRKEIYISKWFAFDRMHFLLDKDEPRITMDTAKVDSEEQQSDTEQETNLDLDENDTLIEENVIVNETQSAERVDKRFTAPATSRQKKRRASERKDADRLDAALNILENTMAKKEMPSDTCSTFGNHVANKIRCYGIRTRAQVELAISNILFEADMGKYENLAPNSFTQ